ESPVCTILTPVPLLATNSELALTVIAPAATMESAPSEPSMRELLASVKLVPPAGGLSVTATPSSVETSKPAAVEITEFGAEFENGSSDVPLQTRGVPVQVTAAAAGVAVRASELPRRSAAPIAT